MSVIIGAVTQGLLWAILAIGVYITYRILDYADLTVEGSYPMGAAIAAILITNEVNPFLATLVAVLGGMAAGYVTGFLHTVLKIPSLLSGILCMTGLYSINLRIMGKANISLNKTDTIVTRMSEMSFISTQPVLFLGLICCILVVLFLWFFFNTEIGFAIRATGNNEIMIRALGVNTNRMKIIGLVLGNSLVALSGALMAQYNKFADVTMGTGTIVIGLASVIIGEIVFSDKTILRSLVSVIMGSVVYRLIIAFVLWLGLPSTDLRLLYSIVLAIALFMPEARKKLGFTIKKGE